MAPTIEQWAPLNGFDLKSTLSDYLFSYPGLIVADVMLSSLSQSRQAKANFVVDKCPVNKDD